MILAATAFWLLPIVLSDNLTGSLALHWGSASLALSTAAFWACGHGKTASNVDWAAWFWLILLLLPGLLLLAFGEPRAPERMLRYGILLILAWLSFATMRPMANRLWTTKGWTTALVISALIHWMLMLYAMARPDSWLHVYVAGTSGPMLQANWQAMFFILGIGALSQRLGSAPSSPRIHNAIWIGAGALLFSGLVLTGSRSGLLAAIFVAVASVMLNRDAQIDHLKRWVIITVGGFVLTKFFFLLGMEPRDTLIREANTGSVGARFMIWAIAWKTFVSHVWLGVGWGGLPSHAMDVLPGILDRHPEWANLAVNLSGAHLYAHNWILQLLLESGVFGGAFAVLLCVQMLRAFFRLKPISGATGQKTAWLICGAILVQGMLSVSAMEPYFWFVFAMAAAAVWPLESNMKTCQSMGGSIQLLPALITSLICVEQVHAATRLNAAIQKPLQVPATITALAKAIDNPWLHATALHALFVKMYRDHVSATQWAASEPFAWALWQTAQRPDYCMIFVAIAHAKGDIFSERRWAKLYLRLKPGFRPAIRVYRHAMLEHGTKPLLLERTW